MKYTYPKIKEPIISYKPDNKVKIKKTINLTKPLNENKIFIKGIIKGIINRKSINITKKVRFPIDIISPNKGLITSKKNSFIPKSILRNKTSKRLIK